MLAWIDISLFTETTAVGRVWGEMEFSHLPCVGDVVPFELVTDPALGFNGLLIVEHVLPPTAPDTTPGISLSDVVATSHENGKVLGELFAENYNLFFDPYGDHK